jgi:signal peptidase II
MTENKEQSTGIRHPSSAFCFPQIQAHLLFWPVFVVGLFFDLWSKRAVFAWLDGSPRSAVVIIDGFLRLATAENPGAAFGIAAGKRNLLIAVSVIALIVVLAVFLLSGNERRLIHFSLGLFAAGVCGNLYDRLLNNGLVRDFIDVVYYPGRHWPAFNVADSLLCVAVGLLVFSSAFTRQPAQERAPQQK